MRTQWLLWGVAALAMGSAAGTAQKSDAVTVQVLAINDFHGNIEPPSGSSGEINHVPAGGAEYLATHLAMAKKDNPNSIVVGAGDIFGASPLISSLFRDQPAIEAANAFGLDVTALGNHELDHGPEGLRERLKDAKFTYLVANATKDGKTLFAPTAIRVVGGVKIGFIGEILEDAPKVISSNSIRGVTFEKEVGAANAAAAALERQGVHTIILLSHEGGFQHATAGADGRRKALDVNGCEGFTGEIADVAEKLSPAIRVIVSGHTHVFYNCNIAGHVVTSASSYGRMFTRFTLTIDRTTDKLIGITAKNEVVTRDVPKDPAETAILDRWKPQARSVADRPSGTISASISKRENDAGESAMGDLIADAQLFATAAKSNGGAQIAFMNSGGVRAELVIPEGQSAPYPVKFSDLYSVQPFGNTLTVRTMTGDMLKRLLEQQFPPQGDPKILQVSLGFTYKYRSKAPAGQHIVAGSMMLNGKPIAPTDSFRVEASDFMASGSEGMNAFKEGTDAIIGPVDVDALNDYVKTHSPVGPGTQDRVQKLD